MVTGRSSPPTAPGRTRRSFRFASDVQVDQAPPRWPGCSGCWMRSPSGSGGRPMRHVPVHTRSIALPTKLPRGRKTKDERSCPTRPRTGVYPSPEGRSPVTTGMLVALMTGCALSRPPCPPTGPGMARASMPAPPSRIPGWGFPFPGGGGPDSMDAGEAIWKSPEALSVAPPADFIGVTNPTDLAFTRQLCHPGELQTGSWSGDILQSCPPPSLVHRSISAAASQSDVFPCYRNRPSSCRGRDWGDGWTADVAGRSLRQ